ncbi:uncharacterized protein LOC141934042 isoform X14 [Strix aluco]|uniref:uncharacterized protein LOC141934042 isoform X14 n=1 Tax=Strix aluco TaxID=111821 RepID=UPI003DA2884C
MRLARGRGKGPRGEEQSPEGSGAPRQRLDGLCRVPLVPSPGAGFLAVPDRLHEINVDLLGRWLCDHQAPSGGRGGEAEKGPRGEEQSPEGSGAPRQRLDGLCRVPLVPSPGAGFLAVPDRLHEINVDLLGRWLCDHQAPSGGRGGEAEKGPRGEEQSPEGSGAPRQRLDGLCRVPLVPSPGAGFLAVPDRLHEINVDLLGRWLCDHQAPSGGRGGEAEKGPRGEEQSPEGSGAPRQRLDGLCRVPLVPSPGAGFLAVPDRLHEINVDLLGRWLCDHQAPSGGRGGEAEKFVAERRWSQGVTFPSTVLPRHSRTRDCLNQTNLLGISLGSRCPGRKWHLSWLELSPTGRGGLCWQRFRASFSSFFCSDPPVFYHIPPQFPTCKTPAEQPSRRRKTPAEELGMGSLGATPRCTPLPPALGTGCLGGFAVR